MPRLSREVLVSTMLPLTRSPAVVGASLAAAGVSLALAFVALRDEPPPITRIVEIPVAVPIPVQQPAPPPAAPAIVRAVEELPFDPSALRPEMVYRGDIRHGVRWRDARGDNVVIFSRRVREAEIEPGYSAESRYLTAYHYRTGDDGTTTLLRRVAESDENCPDDLNTSFHPRSYQVTDLDHDGIGEVTFGYFHGACITDMSAGGFKLFLLEDGAKYVLRGMGHYSEMSDPVVPPVPDPATVRADVFCRHLQTWWPWLSDISNAHR